MLQIATSHPCDDFPFLKLSQPHPRRKPPFAQLRRGGCRYSPLHTAALLPLGGYCSSHRRGPQVEIETFQNVSTALLSSRFSLYHSRANDETESQSLRIAISSCSYLTLLYSLDAPARLKVDFHFDHRPLPLLHMPTLGFLKKKRTKESPGQKDLASPTSSSSQPTSPITPTSSRGFDNSIASVSTQSTAPQVQSIAQPASEPPQETPIVVGEQKPMTQGVTHQQQAYGSAPTEQQNLPTITNLINPPQHDGASQSIGQTKFESANGSAKQHTSSNSAPAAQQPTQVRQTKGKYSLGDFELLRTLGTGSFGRVHLVQSKHNSRFYAVKVLKKVQVVKMKQVEHTNDERKMLQEVKHPFLVTLWGTFQDSKNLYMVMDFVEGGELFSLLRKSQVKSLIKPVLTFTNTYDPAIPESCSKILCS